MQDDEIKRKKQTGADLVPVFLRLPGDIKEALADRAAAEKVSQAALAARILSAELGRDRGTADRVAEWLARV